MLSLLDDQIMTAANSAGLMLFDGSRWSVYAMPGNQIVRAVAADTSGAIFCGGYGFFGFWKGDERGRLIYQDLSKATTAEPIASGEIWNIIVLPGRVVFQTFSEIYIYDYQQVRAITPPGTIMFISEVNGRLLVPSVQYGIFELTDDDEFKLLPGTETLWGKRVAAILPLVQGGYLIGTQKSGFYRYRDEQIHPMNAPLYQELQENQLNRGLRLSNGNYAFGTILNGVYIIDSTMQKVVFHLNKENGLSNNTVLSLLEDPYHNLWVGLDKGISYVRLDDQLVYYDDELVDMGTGYSAALYRDHLYVGTNQGVYYHKWGPGWEGGDDDQFRLIPGSQGQVWQLKVMGDQLLAGHNLGTFLIEDQSMTLISSQVGGWHTIAVPGRDDLLLQATYTGLAAMRKDRSGQWRFSHELKGFSRSLKKILFDDQGYLWGVNPYKGLFRFELNAQSDEIISVRQYTQEAGLPTDFQLSIFLVGEQLVVKSGRDFLMPVGDELVSVSSVAGIDLSPGDYKFIGLSDDEYFKAYPNFVEWFYQGHRERLDISLVPNYEQIIKLTDEIILFCLDRGYALMHTKREKRTPWKMPHPLITEIRVNGDHSLYPVFQPEGASAWVFAPSEKHLQFFVSLPELSRNTLLECRLLGYEQDWRLLDNTLREFTNLPPGEYQFQVRVSGEDSNRGFSFSILPKWYQTSWAKVMYLLVMGLALWAIFRIQKKRMIRQLRKLHIEKERQLHLQRMQARNEQLQANILNKSKELASTTMNLIRKNEILIKIKDRLNTIKSNTPNKIHYTETQKLIHLIDHHLTNEQDWELFEQNFSQVHESFLKKLKNDFPELTPGDLKLAAYLKMNLSSKEIAPLLNISIRGVENKRYRLRSKLGLDGNDNLTEFMMRY